MFYSSRAIDVYTLNGEIMARTVVHGHFKHEITSCVACEVSTLFFPLSLSFILSNFMCNRFIIDRMTPGTDTEPL